MLKKYYGFSTNLDRIRLIFVGKFEDISEAIEYVDSKTTGIIWVLDEKDVKGIISDYLYQPIDVSPLDKQDE